MVPVLRDAQARDLWSSHRSGRLAQAARSGKVVRDELSARPSRSPAWAPRRHHVDADHQSPEVAIVGSTVSRCGRC